MYLIINIDIINITSNISDFIRLLRFAILLHKVQALQMTLPTTFTGSSLDCYGCKDEKNNRGKCSNNIVKCGQFQDACIIEISYRSL